MDGVDLNLDGIPDLVVGSLGSHTLSIIPAKGDGDFKEANLVKTGRFPHYRTYGDWNGDGNLDVVSAAYAGDEINWYENSGAAIPEFSNILMPIVSVLAIIGFRRRH